MPFASERVELSLTVTATPFFQYVAMATPLAPIDVPETYTSGPPFMGGFVGFVIVGLLLVLQLAIAENAMATKGISLLKFMV